MSAVLCVALVPAAPTSAHAESRIAAGEQGVRLSVEAHVDKEAAAGTLGVRVSVEAPRAERESRGGAVGVRVSVPVAQSELVSTRGTVGVRVSVEAPRAERESKGGVVGIRIGVEQSQAERTTLRGTVGVRISSEIMGSYEVTFDSMGGSPVAGQTVSHGAKVLRPADPSKVGHSFSGWYRDYDCTQPFDFTSAVATDIVLYAGWTKVDYTVAVTFDAGGGTFGAAFGGGATYTRTDVPPGAPVPSVAPVDPSRDGCAFAGWWTGDGTGDDGWGEPVGSGTYAPSEEGGAITVFARWVAERVSVEYDSPDTGATLVWRDAIRYGHVLPTAGPDAVPSRSGYLLKGLARADGTAYYGYSYADGSGGWDAVGAGWSRAFDVPWDRLEDVALDRYDADGNAAPDGVPDTVELVAEWDLIFRATVPLWVSVAVHGDDEGHVARVETPDASTFRVVSYTVEPLSVASVAAQGLLEGDLEAAEAALAADEASGGDGPGGSGDNPDAGGSGGPGGDAVDAAPAAGLEGVFCTRGTGAGGDPRELRFADFGGDALSVTLAPAGPDGQPSAGDAMRLAIADSGGTVRSECRSDGADSAGNAMSPLFAIAASDREGASSLGLKLGLEWPAALKVQPNGSKGCIAKVTFTLSATAGPAPRP